MIHASQEVFTTEDGIRAHISPSETLIILAPDKTKQSAHLSYLRPIRCDSRRAILMAIDPRNLRPGELCRLLNSTPLGTVINERHLYRHRNRAGYRLGDGNRVDLLKYVAWLVEEVHRPQVTSDADSYEALKERARARNAAIAKAGRDIGELPAVVDSVRRQKAADSFQYFCEAYFPQIFIWHGQEPSLPGRSGTTRTKPPPFSMR